MTTYSIGMTDKDQVYGWADIQPTVHPQNRLRVLAYGAWKLAAKLADDEYPDWQRIEQLQETAHELEKLADEDAECSCTPRHDCHLCNVVASVIYEE